MVNSTENVRVGDLSAVKLAHHVLSEKGQVGILRNAEGESHVVVISPKSIWQKIWERCQNVFNYILSKINPRMAETAKRPQPQIVPLHNPEITKTMNGIFSKALGSTLKPKEKQKIESAMAKLEASAVNTICVTFREGIEENIHGFDRFETLQDDVRNKAEQALPFYDYDRFINFLTVDVHGQKESSVSLSPKKNLKSEQRANQANEYNRLREQHVCDTLRALAGPSEKEKVETFIREIQNGVSPTANFITELGSVLRKNVSDLPDHVKQLLYFGGQTVFAPVTIGLDALANRFFPGDWHSKAVAEGRAIHVDVTKADDGSISDISISQDMMFGIFPSNPDVPQNPRVLARFVQQTEITMGPEGRREVTNSIRCESSTPADTSPENVRMAPLIQKTFSETSVTAQLTDERRVVQRARTKLAEEMGKTVDRLNDFDAVDNDVQAKAEKELPTGDYHRFLEFLTVNEQKEGADVLSPKKFLALEQQANQESSIEKKEKLKEESERLRREHAFDTLRALTDPSEMGTVENLINGVRGKVQGGTEFNTAFSNSLRDNVHRIPRHLKDVLYAGGQSAMATISITIPVLSIHETLYASTVEERAVNVDVTRAANGSISSILIRQDRQYHIADVGKPETALSSARFVQQTEITMDPEGKRAITNTIQCLSSEPVGESLENKRIADMIQATFREASVNKEYD